MVVLLDTGLKSGVCPDSVYRPVATRIVPYCLLDCNLIASGVFCNSIRMNNLRASAARIAEIFFPIGQSFTHHRPNEPHQSQTLRCWRGVLRGRLLAHLDHLGAPPGWFGTQTTAVDHYNSPIAFKGRGGQQAPRRTPQACGRAQLEAKPAQVPERWMGAVSQPLLGTRALGAALRAG
jgi:hypothetical protein